MRLYIEIKDKDGIIHSYNNIGAFEIYHEITWLYPIGKHLVEALRVETKNICEIQIERIEE